MNDRANPTTRNWGARWLGLFLALFGILIVRAAVYAFYPPYSFPATAWRESQRDDNWHQSRRARQTCWRADFQREADDPHDVFRIILTHNRSPFRVQPLHAAIVVHDAELDR